MEIIEIYVDDNFEERIDVYLTNELGEYSRSYIQKLIKDSNILVNGDNVKSRYEIKKGDLISIKFPETDEIELKAEDIPIKILYEDNDIAIIDKPSGMVVHPAHGNPSGTLVNSLLFHIDKLSKSNEGIRPGIVHRLDKDTSGLLIIAKNDYSHSKLVKSFKERNIKREYILLVKGLVNNKQGTINLPIGRDTKDRRKMAVTDINSREAITNYEVIEYFNKYTYIKANLVTGRMHQIRVHFSHINHPIVGDTVYTGYNNPFNIKHQLLHAKTIGFKHPRTDEYVEFTSEVPERFIKVINMLK